VPIRDLVGWWKLDEDDGRTARDASGHSLNGTLLGNLQWESDASRKALRFGDGEGYVDCGIHPSLEITGAVTVTAWIKTAEISRLRWPSIIARTGGWEFRMIHETGTLEFSCKGIFSKSRRVDFAGIRGDVPVRAGHWHHVAAVFDGTRLHLHVNGHVDRVEPTTGEVIIQPDQSFRIGGGSPYGLTICWEGLIDDVRIYRRALSAEELSCLYEHTR